MLRRRGVSPHDADEAIQETAARAVSAEVDFADADDLLRWASVVSWRVAIDARRRCRMSGSDIPDQPDHVDVAQTAEHRIVLSAVTSRFKELSERDREVLLTSFQDGVSANRHESMRLAAARHRARARLRRMLEGLATPILAFAGRRRSHTSPEQVMVATAPVVTCLALAVTTIVGPATNQTVATGHTMRSAPVAIASEIYVPAKSAPIAAPPPSTAGESNEQHRLPAPAPSGVTAGLHVDEPEGQSTDISTRPRRPDDHLACVTLPSTSGLVTTCVDPPVPGSP